MLIEINQTSLIPHPLTIGWVGYHQTRRHILSHFQVGQLLLMHRHQLAEPGTLNIGPRPTNNFAYALIAHDGRINCCQTSHTTLASFFEQLQPDFRDVPHPFVKTKAHPQQARSDIRCHHRSLDQKGS